MKSKAVALGHPIHPMLIPFPFAFLTGAALFDAVGWFRDVPSWWTTGGHLSLAGIATAVLAAIPGVIDYLLRGAPGQLGEDPGDEAHAGESERRGALRRCLVDARRRGGEARLRWCCVSRPSVLDCSAPADIWAARWSRGT